MIFAANPHQYRVHIFTFADKRFNHVCALAGTVAAFNHQLNLLGTESKDMLFHPFTKKFLWMQYAVHSPPLDISDLILFVDGFDTIVQCNISDLPNVFYKLTNNSPGIVFSGENNCWPFNRNNGAKNVSYMIRMSATDEPMFIKKENMCTFLKDRQKNAGPYRYLNSGAYVGDVASIRRFFQLANTLVKNNFTDDQLISQLIFAQNPNINIIIDTKAEIFLSFHGIKRGDINEVDTIMHKCRPGYFDSMKNPSKNNLINKTAFIVHFNGPSKKFAPSCMNEIQRTIVSKTNFSFFDVDRNVTVSAANACM